MLEHAEDLARAKGCRALILDAAFFRTEAHAFYEHNGFAKDCYSFET